MSSPPCPPLNECFEISMSDDVNPERGSGKCTVCDGDKTDNIWFQPGPPGFPGRCILDELTFEQVYYVLQRVPQAKPDLLRITSDPVLIQLANDSRLVTDEIESNQKAADMINKQGTLPFYTLMRGVIDGSII